MLHAKQKFTKGRISITKKAYFPYLLILPSIAILAGIGLFPFIYAIWLSLHNIILVKPWIPLKLVGGENFKAIFTNPTAMHSLEISLIFTIFAVAIEFLLGLGIAMLLLYRPIKGQAVFRTLLITPMVVAPAVIGLIWRFLLYPGVGVLTFLGDTIGAILGIKIPLWLANLNTALPTIVFIDAWHWTPFMIIIFFAGLVGLPTEPFEAAKVDGASAFQIFTMITLPLLKPVILVALVIRSMDAFRIFDEIFVLTGGGPGSATETACFYLYRLSFRFFRTSEGAAMALLLFGISLIMSLLYIKTLGRRKEA